MKLNPEMVLLAKKLIHGKFLIFKDNKFQNLKFLQCQNIEGRNFSDYYMLLEGLIGVLTVNG